MAERHVDPIGSRRVELAIGELDAISVLPCVAVQYISRVVGSRFSPAVLAEIVEGEPALAARILSLVQRLGLGTPRDRYTVRLALDRLPADAVRDAVLGMKVSASFEIQFPEEARLAPSREDLLRHCIAVACAARRIARISPLSVDEDLAYSGGLLHDLGKLALAEIMPKSLAAMADEARAAGKSLHEIEQAHLGTDHARLGRLLAQRWNLDPALATAIWLHHGGTENLLDRVPGAAAAHIVKAADAISRSAEIGVSGSYDAPQSLDRLAPSLQVTVAALRQVRNALSEEIAQKVNVLGLDMPDATAGYCDVIQSAAAALSKKQTELTDENRTLLLTSGYLDFTRQWLCDIGPDCTVIEMAERLAQRWQRFFQTGSVCLFLTPAPPRQTVDVVLVEALGHSRKTVLDVEGIEPLVPPAIASKFLLLEARNHLDWLIERIDIEMAPSRTRLIPLLSNGRAVGVMAFELNYPGDAAFFAERFQMAAQMAGAVVGLALATETVQQFSDRLIDVAGSLEAAGPPAAVSPMKALAEMAAGVAHELNNPLSVISGRAQLLAQALSDDEAKKSLDQIQENAREASMILDDLMSFADPMRPKTATTEVRQIVEEALELAGQIAHVEHINAQTSLPDDLSAVAVDSAQVVSALANIICNAVESYADTIGPVKIVALATEGTVSLQVSDLGRGMDAETLHKATQPFFSARSAGRKRGMGLAYAARLIELNAGSLEIASELGKGTTVTISLPTA